jgi:Fe-S-cluster containining protein
VGHPLQHRNAHPKVLLQDVLELRPTASSDLGLAITVMKVIAMFLTEKQTWHCEFLEKKTDDGLCVVYKHRASGYDMGEAQDFTKEAPQAGSGTDNLL